MLDFLFKEYKYRYTPFWICIFFSIVFGYFLAHEFKIWWIFPLITILMIYSLLSHIWYRTWKLKFWISPVNNYFIVTDKDQVETIKWCKENLKWNWRIISNRKIKYINEYNGNFGSFKINSVRPLSEWKFGQFGILMASKRDMALFCMFEDAME